MLYGQVLLFEHYLLFINEKNEFKILTSKFLTRFGPFFGKKMAIFGQKSTFRPIFQNLVLGSSLFCIFKLFFGFIYEITQ